jgi:hypothetical protein
VSPSDNGFMRQPWFVVEELGVEPGHRVVRLLGVEWRTTSLWWVSALWMVSFGAVFATAIAPRSRQNPRSMVGLGALVPPAALVHTLGHWTGGRLVGAPLSGVVLNASIPFDLYPEMDEVAGRVHLARALGGPLMSLAVGGVTAFLGARHRSLRLRYFGALNLMIGICALAPIPDIDGPVVLREVRLLLAGKRPLSSSGASQDPGRY